MKLTELEKKADEGEPAPQRDPEAGKVPCTLTDWSGQESAKKLPGSGPSGLIRVAEPLDSTVEPLHQMRTRATGVGRWGAGAWQE